MEIITRGFTICQIMPSINYMNRYVESLRYWLPLYVTGQTKVYYYPRLRDNLYRHSMIVLSGHFAIFSTCVGMTSNPITLLTTNPSLVYAYTGQYNDYLSLCQPALTVHNTSEELMDCFEDFFSQPGSIVQKVFPISATTIPREILEQLRDKTDHVLWKTAYEKNLNELSSFEEHLKHTPFIDICELSDPKDIRSGMIPIAAPYKTYGGQSMYTPETYVLHLKNILRLMDTYENYYFIPSKPDTRHDYNLFVKKEGMALLVRNTAPTLIIELKRPEIVTACREHLLRMAEQYCDGMQRTKARMQINALIHDLQE